MLPLVLQHMQALGHQIFTTGDYNLNLFGIRSSDRTSGKFNDFLGCAYKVKDLWRVEYWPATTDPGVYYLEHPLNVSGTAILIPGQYRGVYAVDKHAGKYDALCQRNGPVRVWRDNDRDAVLDHDVDEESGYFGINIHASSSDPYTSDTHRGDTAEVGKWSAGCQVHADSTGFRRMMALVDKQDQAHPTWARAYTYTLLDEW